MLFLRQSTASQSAVIGPFVDDTDGKTPEPGLTIANTDILIAVNGSAFAPKNLGGGTHNALGYYSITLNATDTDTVGRLQLAVNVAGALPVYHEFYVLEEAIFDALFGAGSVAPATAAALSTVGSNVTAIKAKTDNINFGVAGKVDANITHVNEIEVGGNGSGPTWGPA